MPWNWVGFTGWVLFEDTMLALWIWESLRLTGGMARQPGGTAAFARDDRAGGGGTHRRAAPGKHQVQTNPGQPAAKRGEVPFPGRIVARRHFSGGHRRAMGLLQFALAANDGTAALRKAWARAGRAPCMRRTRAGCWSSGAKCVRERKEFSQEFRLVSPAGETPLGFLPDGADPL